MAQWLVHGKPCRFVGGVSPVMTVTKWHDIETGIMQYDLYINGKPDGRYDLEGLRQRFLEVMMDV